MSLLFHTISETVPILTLMNVPLWFLVGLGMIHTNYWIGPFPVQLYDFLMAMKG